MHSIASMRRGALLLILAGGALGGWALAGSVLGGALGLAQSPALPATRRTVGAIPASAPNAAQPAGRRAQIIYSQGRLEIGADNSSLNQILREIARQTGMKITGGVNDERVYGRYGPAAPADILATLIEGTGSNMLLRETASGAPAELILTPRQGGPTPPNPSAPGFDDDAQASEQPNESTPPSNQRTGPSRPASVPRMPDSAMTPSGPVPQAQPAPGFIDAPTSHPSTEPGTTPGPNTQSTGTSDPPTSPNGVKTPQQVYQMLQQLQSQQPANPK